MRERKWRKVKRSEEKYDVKMITHCAFNLSERVKMELKKSEQRENKGAGRRNKHYGTA